ncbi:hypothetical protein [Magnetospirillum sp. 15-1]|uniref:hypothetical protein n=1 Tax=Magnetospirillum sp. 15-1 TaxID=1979370 RepID=UPI00114428E4|nr:hypothetical protein [Magnetospirillum sp. 15-1]
MPVNFDIPDRLEISVPVEGDDDGYLDKECPNENCLSQFKILKDDWDRIEQSGQVVCPFCRHEAPPGSWWTTEQIEHAKAMALEQAKHLISTQLNRMFKDIASDFNRSQRSNSFFKMTMDVRETGRPPPVMIPAAAAETMRTRITCGKCGCRYAVIGTAYFCPGCGERDVEAAFSAKIAKIRTIPETIEALRAVLDKDQAADLANTLLEDAIKGGVTQFETMAKYLYSQINNSGRIRQNLFQNLTDGSLEWEKVTGVPYTVYLDQQEIDRLNVYFQRRHVLGHNDGHVDEKYVVKSGDQSYQPEQRIVVKVDAVLEFAALLTKLVSGMRGSVSSMAPPGTEGH